VSAGWTFIAFVPQNFFDAVKAAHELEKVTSVVFDMESPSAQVYPVEDFLAVFKPEMPNGR
jgi:hypothetical protein